MESPIGPVSEKESKLDLMLWQFLDPGNLAPLQTIQLLVEVASGFRIGEVVLKTKVAVPVRLGRSHAK